MNTPTPRGTPSLTLPSTQNTAPILEFGCLYTLDIRRKAKRWHDGFLRFHTFNKRVMVYDVPRNFIGDVHWRESGDLQDGDEITLEKGVLVQVGEPIGRAEQDLTGLWEKKARDREDRVKNGQATPRLPYTQASSTPISIQAEQSPTPRSLPLLPAQLRPRSLNSLLGLTKRSSGRVEAPVRTPFEQRYGIPSEEPPPKRHKPDSERSRSDPSAILQRQTISTIPNERNLGRSATGSGEISQPREVIEIPDDDNEAAPRKQSRNTKLQSAKTSTEKPILNNDDKEMSELTRSNSAVAHLPSKPLRISSSSSRKKLFFQDAQPQKTDAFSKAIPIPLISNQPVHPPDALGRFQEEQQARMAARLSRKGKPSIDPFQEFESTQFFEDAASIASVASASPLGHAPPSSDPDSLFVSASKHAKPNTAVSKKRPSSPSLTTITPETLSAFQPEKGKKDIPSHSSPTESGPAKVNLVNPVKKPLTRPKPSLEHGLSKGPTSSTGNIPSTESIRPSEHQPIAQKQSQHTVQLEPDAAPEPLPAAPAAPLANENHDLSIPAKASAPVSKIPKQQTKPAAARTNIHSNKTHNGPHDDQAALKSNELVDPENLTNIEDHTNHKDSKHVENAENLKNAETVDALPPPPPPQNKARQKPGPGSRINTRTRSTGDASSTHNPSYQKPTPTTTTHLKQHKDRHVQKDKDKSSSAGTGTGTGASTGTGTGTSWEQTGAWTRDAFDLFDWRPPGFVD